MKKYLVITLVVFIVMSTAQAAFAARASLGMQVVQNVQLVAAVEEAQNTIAAINDQIDLIRDHMQIINNPLFNDMVEAQNRIFGTIEDANRLVFRVQNFQDELRRMYRSADDFQRMTTVQEFADELNSIHEYSRANVQATLEAVGLHGQELQQDAQTLNEIQSRAEQVRSTGSEGGGEFNQGQLLNAGNEILAFQTQQLMQMRDILNVQTQFMAEQREAELTRMEAAQEFLSQAWEPRPRETRQVRRFGQ